MPRPFSRGRTLVRVKRERPFVKERGGRSAIFGGAGLLSVVPAWRCRFGRLGTDSLDVAGELPDFLRGHSVAESGHALGPAIADGGEDRDHLRAVIPPAVEESRAGAAAAIGMAALAAEPRIETLALAEIIGVALLGLAERERDLGWGAAEAVRHQRDPIGLADRAGRERDREGFARGRDRRGD